MSEMSIYSIRGLGSFALCTLVNCIFDCFYLHWFIVYILQMVCMGIAVIPALLNSTCSPHENQWVGISSLSPVILMKSAVCQYTVF